MPKNDNLVSCKIGTIPALVKVWRNQKPQVGKKLKVREVKHGELSKHWTYVFVDAVNPDGYFFASR
jgi:hypothetical protein